MVTEKQLMGKKYSFKHIVVEINEKDEKGNVHLFSATYVRTALPGEISDGLVEINQTLWDQESKKRPPGYYIVGQKEISSGVFQSFLMSEEYIDQKMNKEMTKKYGYSS